MIDVFLADLRHNYGGVLSTDCMPLGIGFLKAVMDQELPAEEVRTRLFCYPDRLLEAMESAPPDVLMVSNYVWNEALGHAFLRRARRLNPEALTVMGGPNLSIEAERQVAYVADQPHLDVYVLGEGEFVATELVERLLEARGVRERVLERELPSSVWRRPDGELCRSEVLPRRRSVDDIPSPYLSGIMDEFFDGKLAPMIETNRGCPFRCTFCVQGTGFYGKVNYFDRSRIRDEIRYIARIIHERSPHMGTLRIADPNYGMYERDVEISGYIGEMQAQYGWPTFIDATTGKNRPDRIIESMEKVNGALVLYQAVQSLDDTVLRNIDRSNIKLEAYEQIQVHVRGRGLRSTSDLILGLPGESLDSHLTGLRRLIDAGTHQAHCFQAMVLKGAELEQVETRERFGFRTKFRVLPKNFGIYGKESDEKVIDIEEIVVATDTLPFEDYVICRKHHLTFSIFWNDSWFRDPVAFVQNLGIRPSEWLDAMLDAMERDDGAVRRLLDDFVAETRGELFDTREACCEFYSRDENFTRLCGGEIGDNLMYKYRAKASFFDWKAVCAAGMAATRRLIEERGLHRGLTEFDALWEDLTAFVEARHASGRDSAEITAPVEASLRFDLPRWAADGHPTDFAPYRLDAPRRFRFELTDEGAEELRKALDVWTSRLTGLTKLVTRIRIDSQVRACQPAERERAAETAVPSVR